MMLEDRSDISQPTDLHRLVYPTAIRHPDDVARLRSVLNAHGYDASDRDIQSAYGDWSEAEWAAGWTGMGGMTDDELFAVLWGRLEHDDGRDGTPREDAK